MSDPMNHVRPVTAGMRVAYQGGDRRPDDMRPGDTWNGEVLCRVGWWRPQADHWPVRAQLATPEEAVAWIGPDGSLKPDTSISGTDWMVIVPLDRFARAVDRFSELLMPSEGVAMPHEQPAAGGYLDHHLAKGGVILGNGAP